MRRGTALAIATALIGVFAAASPAAAATLTTIDTPSTQVDPSKVRFNGAGHPGRLRANVLLPDGYDGKRQYPVLYLLHGAGDSFSSWSDPQRGDILNTAAGLDAIVVMPEAATGFYANWWNGGRRADPGWERFYLDELVPMIERWYRVRPGRRWHAVAGLSMGGLGATYLAGQLPGYFGSAATFSGFVAHQRPESEAGLTAVAGVNYGDIFGPREDFYATGHNPSRLADNLRSTRVYATVGSGVAEPGVQSSPQAVLGGGLIEAELRLQADEFVTAARNSGVDLTYRPQDGVHDWPYWRRHLREAIGWGLFEPVAEAPASWTYRTVAARGEAWGLRYGFAAPPSEVVTLSREGDRLRGSGSGTVTIRNAARCGFSATLPFDRALPPAICGRLGATVTPRRVRAGRRTRVRVRVVRRVGAERLPVAGARVRIGRRAKRTDADGATVLRYRPRGRAGVRRVQVQADGLGRVIKRVRVVAARSR